MGLVSHGQKLGPPAGLGRSTGWTRLDPAAGGENWQNPIKSLFIDTQQ
jgi:hypothetical protein